MYQSKHSMKDCGNTSFRLNCFAGEGSSRPLIKEVMQKERS